MTDKQIKEVFKNGFYCIEPCPEIKELLVDLKAKEQECEYLRKDIKDIANLLDLDTGEEYNFGNIESAIKNYCADCDVAERMRKVTYAATGGRLSYANYTVEAIEQAYNDQLRIDVEYRTKELEEQLDQLKLQLAYKEADEEEIKRIIKPYLTREDDLEVYDLDWIIKGFCNELDQLKAENEQLKKAEEYDSRYNDMQAEIDCGNAIIEKYEQTLAEIKEMIPPPKGAKLHLVFEEILKKISEVEK
jgi:hypothetical protein